MSFYIKNKTTHSRNILLSDNRNISIGATGSYNDTIQLADADIKDSVVVALSNAGILEIVSEENVAVKIQETAQEIEQNRRDKEQQLLAEMNAAKEIVANMGTSAGTSISLTNDAGQQLAADLGRSVIQGTSQFVAKKLREVKVNLKAGYRVFLLPNDK